MAAAWQAQYSQQGQQLFGTATAIGMKWTANGKSCAAVTVALEVQVLVEVNWNDRLDYTIPERLLLLQVVGSALGMSCVARLLTFKVTC